MLPAPSRLRPFANDEALAALAAPHSDRAAAVTAVAASATHRLNWLECGFGFLVLLSWLSLFGGGIIVDTEPYRRAISTSGVDALNVEGGRAGGSGAAAAMPLANPAALATAWLVVLCCFVPLNLAWLCVASSMLGTVGSLANLSDDHSLTRSRDMSNPYTSALLRGFFVYLFMMSGLLLLDDSPFSDTGPGQYIRLAGFLSLFSFVVSYQPRLFSSLMMSAFQRIQVRGGENASNAVANTESDTVRASVDVERGTIDVAVAKHSSQAVVDSERKP